MFSPNSIKYAVLFCNTLLILTVDCLSSQNKGERGTSYFRNSTAEGVILSFNDINNASFKTQRVKFGLFSGKLDNRYDKEVNLRISVKLPYVRDLRKHLLMMRMRTGGKAFSRYRPTDLTQLHKKDKLMQKKRQNIWYFITLSSPATDTVSRETHAKSNISLQNVDNKRTVDKERYTQEKNWTTHPFYVRKMLQQRAVEAKQAFSNKKAGAVNYTTTQIILRPNHQPNYLLMNQRRMPGTLLLRPRRQASTEQKTVKVDWGLGRGLKLWEIAAIVAGCGLFVTLVIIGVIWSCCAWSSARNPALPARSPYGGVEADKRRPSMMNPHYNQKADSLFKREALRSGAADGTPYYGSRRGTQVWSPKPDDAPNQKHYLVSPTPVLRSYTPRNSFSMVPVIMPPQDHDGNHGASPVLPHRREVMEPIQGSPVQERRWSGASQGRSAAFPTIKEKETLSASPSPEPKTPKKYDNGRRSGRSVRRISAISLSENMDTFKQIPWGDISAPKDAFGAG
ncbi:uncharacterized protein LOC106174623 [Lingula anatina]|uniref:Uncharacterized protein LOC106174623 n=1 Tax=Lingula anatina TaxID=7574 RepID=A0A1S3JMY0_LINAN|nr:uncharacterized protein LOC106174623 [Lingula anatina]|eukprot:XP_013411735.1 uncharacterized protein LOC106174623 [Lingula anatina]